MDNQFWGLETSTFRIVSTLNEDVKGYTARIEERDDITGGILEEASMLLDRAQWELEVLVGKISRAGFSYTKQDTEALFQKMDFAFGISASQLKQTVAFLTQEGLPSLDQIDDFYDASLALQKTLCLFLEELAEVQ